MELFSEAYMRCAQTYWGEYISEKKQLPGEKPPSRSVIWDSWKRSLKYGVDCRPQKHPRVSEKAFSSIVKKNEALIRIAYPYILNLYHFIEGSNFGIHLTDRSGCTLKLLVNDQAVKTLTNHKIDFTEGFIRNEKLT